MKSTKWQNFQFLLSKPLSIHQPDAAGKLSFSVSFSCLSSLISKIPDDSSANSKSKELALTPEELTKINLLIPRLCLSNHLTTAIQLTTTALMANPCPKSFSFSILIHSLTLQPDLKLPMSLLNRLKHTPRAHSCLAPITTLLITSYLKKGSPKDALKVYNWILRPESPCMVEKTVYGVLVGEFCRTGLVLEGLSVLRDMVKVNLRPGEGLRERIFRSLLREARIREALELKEALSHLSNSTDGVEKVLNLLDLLIRNWTV
ncbi:hypothetical protein SLA2020_227990 [Shorea laevis]